MEGQFVHVKKAWRRKKQEKVDIVAGKIGTSIDKELSLMSFNGTNINRSKSCITQIKAQVSDTTMLNNSVKTVNKNSFHNNKSFANKSISI